MSGMASRRWVAGSGYLLTNVPAPPSLLPLEIPDVDHMRDFLVQRTVPLWSIDFGTVMSLSHSRDHGILTCIDPGSLGNIQEHIFNCWDLFDRANVLQQTIKIQDGPWKGGEFKTFPVHVKRFYLQMGKPWLEAYKLQCEMNTELSRKGLDTANRELVLGYHGFKIETMYSIIFHNKLKASGTAPGEGTSGKHDTTWVGVYGIEEENHLNFDPNKRTRALSRMTPTLSHVDCLTQIFILGACNEQCLLIPGGGPCRRLTGNMISLLLGTIVLPGNLSHFLVIRFRILTFKRIRRSFLKIV